MKSVACAFFIVVMLSLSTPTMPATVGTPRARVIYVVDDERWKHRLRRRNHYAGYSFGW